VRFSHGSRNRLTTYDLDRFAGESLFDRIARAVCRAGCLPRKELFEAWETARRVRRVLRGGRVVDLAAGHGLLAHLMLLLDDSSPSAIAVDAALPPSAATLHRSLVEQWPRLDGRVSFVTGSVDAFAIQPDDVVVSVHACGALTDIVLDRATAARARVAVLPCCHDTVTCQTGALSGWLDAALAIDVMRARRLEERQYSVRTQLIPADITPQNRLLIGTPLEPRA
jgi:hypothetical protein